MYFTFFDDDKIATPMVRPVTFFPFFLILPSRLTITRMKLTLLKATLRNENNDFQKIFRNIETAGKLFDLDSRCIL